MSTPSRTPPIAPTFRFLDHDDLRRFTWLVPGISLTSAIGFVALSGSSARPLAVALALGVATLVAGASAAIGYAVLHARWARVARYATAVAEGASERLGAAHPLTTQALEVAAVARFARSFRALPRVVDRLNALHARVQTAELT